MIDPKELTNAFEGAHQLLDDLERRLAAKREAPEAVRATLVKIIETLASHGKRVPLSDKPLRGLGYGQNDALIVASLPWFKENLSAAIRAHHGDLTQQDVNNHARRIRGHRQKIEAAEGVQPWETSLNWLGDLPAK